MCGALLAYRPFRLPGSRVIYDVLSAVVLAGGVVLLWLVWPYEDMELRMPLWATRILISVDKQNLHPMRLMSIFALVWLVIRTVPASARWLRSRASSAFVLCGQHSLAVFCSGIFLSFLGRLAMEERPDWGAQAVVNLLGATALVGVGALAAWYRNKGRVASTVLPAAERAGNAGMI